MSALPAPDPSRREARLLTLFQEEEARHPDWGYDAISNAVWRRRPDRTTWVEFRLAADGFRQPVF